MPENTPLATERSTKAPETEVAGDASRARLALVAILLACAAVILPYCAILLHAPIERRMSVFPDDAFYYLVPALNIARGLGPTSDGVALTSGFHPLWMGVLVCLARLFGANRQIYLDAVVLLGVILHVASAVLIYRAACRLVRPMLAAVWCLLFALGATPLLQAASGSESALVAFLLACLVYVEAQPRVTSHGQSVVRGLLLGAIVLARTDCGIFCVGWLALHAIVNYRLQRSVARALSSVAVPALVAAATVAPWFVLARIVYGSDVQQSMAMKEYWRSTTLAGASTYASRRFTAHLLAAWVQGVAAYPIIAVLAAFVAGVALARPGGVQRSGEDQAPDLDRLRLNAGMVAAALAIHVASAGVFYALRFPYLKPWYFAPAWVLWPVAGIVASSFAWGRAPDRALRIAQSVLACLLLASIALGAFDLVNVARGLRRSTTPPPSGGGLASMALWIEKNLPPDATIGAYSAGILSFYSNHRVVNLDGLCNNDILRVARTRTMAEYIDRRGIGYIADHRSVTWPSKTGGLTWDASPDFVARRMQEIHRVPCASEWGDVVLWRVLPAR